jgi:hypothetical protein
MYVYVLEPYTKCVYNNNSVALVRELTIPTERPLLVDEVSAKFVDKGCRVVSTSDSYGRILGFLDGTVTFSSK